MAHKVTKLDDGDFEYRGVEFTRVDRLIGYSDHYQSRRKVNGIPLYGATRRELLAAIDRTLDAAQATQTKATHRKAIQYYGAFCDAETAELIAQYPVTNDEDAYAASVQFVREYGAQYIIVQATPAPRKPEVTQAAASIDDDMVCTLAGLARLLHDATDKAWDTAVPADVLHRMRFLADELEQVSGGDDATDGKGFEPEYLYQMNVRGEWVICWNKARYDEAIAHGFDVRRFALVKE